MSVSFTEDIERRLQRNEKTKHRAMEVEESVRELAVCYNKLSARYQFQSTSLLILEIHSNNCRQERSFHNGIFKHYYIHAYAIFIQKKTRTYLYSSCINKPVTDERVGRTRFSNTNVRVQLQDRKQYCCNYLREREEA